MQKKKSKSFGYLFSTQSEILNGKLGCFAPCKNGDFLIGLDLSFYIYNPLSQNLSKFVDLKDEPLENRINDGTTDPRGRFWVGTMTSEGNKKKQRDPPPPSLARPAWPRSKSEEQEACTSLI